jgi:hypothetical protein
LEIQNLLKEVHNLNDVAERLIRYLDAHPDNITLDNITSLSRFLINANLNSVLVGFVLHYIDNENFPIPSPYFLEALGNISEDLDDKIVRALIEGITEDNAEGEASRSKKLSGAIPELKEWRSQRKYKIQQEYLSNKQLLLDQLITLRTQQLFAQEKKLLVRLQKLYPGDAEIIHEAKEHQQRYALDILQRHAPKAQSVNVAELSRREPEVEIALQALMTSLLEQAAQLPEMAFDFSIIAFMLESYETALTLLGYSEENEAKVWFRLEVLLRGKRFIELLDDISRVELMLAHEPETFFATAYYRAQALWGIGQKHSAIEVLEGLLASRPNYRAASTLLSIWSSQ